MGPRTEIVSARRVTTTPSGGGPAERTDCADRAVFTRSENVAAALCIAVPE